MIFLFCAYDKKVTVGLPDFSRLTFYNSQASQRIRCGCAVNLLEFSRQVPQVLQVPQTTLLFLSCAAIMHAHGLTRFLIIIIHNIFKQDYLSFFRLTNMTNSLLQENLQALNTVTAKSRNKDYQLCTANKIGPYLNQNKIKCYQCQRLSEI